jgi:chromosome segregation protein
VSADLEAELTRTRGRLAELHGHVADLAAAAASARQELAAAATQEGRQRQEVQALADGLEAGTRRLAELREQVQADGAAHMEQERRAGHERNNAVAFKAEMDNFRRERERVQLRTARAAEDLASLDVELQELTEAEAALQRRLAGARQDLAAQKQERERLRQLHDETAESISQLRQRRSGLASRAEVLEGLERSHEGLGSGVREVFSLLEQPAAAPWGSVLGMIADFLTVRREYAPLIDVALGDWSQRFLVRDLGRLDEALAQRGQPFSGRVSFLPLHDHGGEARGNERRPNRLLEMSLPGRVRMPATAAGTPAHPGVVAPAVAVVTCDHPELRDLPAQLLAHTLIVRDLASARAIAAHTSGYRLVTLQGELLEPDGTLTVGTHHAETGILSRKSELRELKQQLAELDHRLTETERDLVDLRERVGDLDVDVTGKEQGLTALTEQCADLHYRLEKHRTDRQGLHEQVQDHHEQMRQLEGDIARLEKTYQAAAALAAAAEAEGQALQRRIKQAAHETREREQEQQRRQQEYTDAKVALATVEERLAALGELCRSRESDLQQRRAEHAQGGQQVQALKGRLTDSQRALLQASAALALRYLDKEAAERRVAELTRERAAQRSERARLANLAQQVRTEWRAQQEQVHVSELQVNDVRHRLGALAERLREDYQLELADLYREFVAKLEAIPEAVPVDAALPADAPPAPLAADAEAVAAVLALDPAAANDEITELRKKLNRLGSVNLDSLQELSELETRAGTLQTQYDDLAAAKKSLEEIIARINADSRRLFTETFATIRTHFQELFRKLFAGGMADIVLEDETDILESGIEIIARPPGKELRSISLMSGGEKTMTAVALLLAIFRSRPSPFCILDEVDAALDEANVGRFTAVLREFLVLSQFIIVTHSKKTMATADVLYGITMQESGISKRVAVRFEDWPDDMPPQNGHAKQPEETFAGR